MTPPQQKKKKEKAGTTVKATPQYKDGYDGGRQSHSDHSQ